MPTHNALIGGVQSFIQNDVVDRMGLAAWSGALMSRLDLPSGVELMNPDLLGGALVVWGVYDGLYNYLYMKRPKRVMTGVSVAVLTPYLITNYASAVRAGASGRLIGRSPQSFVYGDNALALAGSSTAVAGVALMLSGTFGSNANFRSFF